MSPSTLACVLLFLFSFTKPPAAPAYHYYRTGNATNVSATPKPGFALMGGGKDLDEAFRWLCDHAGHGDLLVLRASGDDDYNLYIQDLCHLNSVATLILPSREAATDPFVEHTIHQASALFIAGGDQANYINFWQGTPVQSALNEAIHRGVPIGGTSAGLAVLGEYVYSAQGDQPDDPNLDARLALADPFSPRITLVKGFLDIPILKGVITDSHFAKRNRMGRLLTFLARLNAQANGIGIEERAAVLLEPSGKATVVGNGSAYFVDAHTATGAPAKNQPLTYGDFNVVRVGPTHIFNLSTWSDPGDATHYKLTVTAGKINSTQPNDSLY